MRQYCFVSPHTTQALFSPPFQRRQDPLDKPCHLSSCQLNNTRGKERVKASFRSRSVVVFPSEGRQGNSFFGEGSRSFPGSRFGTRSGLAKVVKMPMIDGLKFSCTPCVKGKLRMQFLAHCFFPKFGSGRRKVGVASVFLNLVRSGKVTKDKREGLELSRLRPLLSP